MRYMGDPSYEAGRVCCVERQPGDGKASLMRSISRQRPSPAAFAGFRYPPEVIMLAVRWYLRFGLSYRDLEELLAERGIEVDHVTLYRWVQRFTPLIVEAARPRRHAAGDRWFVDETYVKVAGRWRYVYRAIDQHGEIVDVYLSTRRDTAAASRFFSTAIAAHGAPAEVTTDKAHALAVALRGVLPDAWHDTTQYANNRIESDHSSLKSRLRPMRGLKRDRAANVVITGHAFIQNLRRGHYELGTYARRHLAVAAAFDELTAVL
jgi:transposase, IS6 family